MDKYKIGNVTDNEKYAASNKVYYVILDSTEFFFFFFFKCHSETTCYRQK